METRQDLKRICPICGKEIYYRHIIEDGMDWEGHRRGSEEEWNEGYNCTCDNVQFKRMCINCEHYKNNNCTNDYMVRLFAHKIEKDTPVIIEDVKIRIPDDKVTMSCDYWNINADMIAKYFKK